jgi:acyl carrier protein
MQKKQNLTQDRIIDFVSWQLNVPSTNIFPSSNLIDDLNLDPLDKMLLIAELESRLNVFLTSEEADNIETIQDVSQFFNLHAA